MNQRGAAGGNEKERGMYEVRSVMLKVIDRCENYNQIVFVVPEHDSCIVYVAQVVSHGFIFCGVTV